MITDVYGVQGVLIQVMFLDGNKITNFYVSPKEENEDNQGQTKVRSPAEVADSQVSYFSHDILLLLVAVGFYPPPAKPSVEYHQCDTDTNGDDHIPFCKVHNFVIMSSEQVSHHDEFTDAEKDPRRIKEDKPFIFHLKDTG